MPFYQRIAFKQNQISKDEETGKKLKMIDAGVFLQGENA